ncbi:hypothetical protein ASPVEDRAFT_343705 [Aspergillus versicolor CBS 583.65]|uniref:Uncharacterized protein n=1 Tax=Aspergillus versicolor CBS 583.65 TaxID=1036611 RepID=A0A1L9PZH7_ASPVE|nr:uncharacterized protein ASPVEDRAFT_343705 [Aspergillus versicolor CBS 583.65]OJJ06893.1 hypothetical protein ASPVEDRAFT_343705 [Aspergillus versicolor CBS 583.65]
MWQTSSSSGANERMLLIFCRHTQTYLSRTGISDAGLGLLRQSMILLNSIDSGIFSQVVFIPCPRSMFLGVDRCCDVRPRHRYLSTPDPTENGFVNENVAYLTSTPELLQLLSTCQPALFSKVYQIASNLIPGNYILDSHYYKTAEFFLSASIHRMSKPLQLTYLINNMP